MNKYVDYNYMERVENQRISRIARVKQVRRQKILLLIGLFITILLCTLFTIKAFAYPNVKNSAAKGTKMYKSITIYCGDTIESISSEYFTESFSSVNEIKNEIMSINHISKDEVLIPGNYIVVPYYE